MLNLKVLPPQLRNTKGLIYRGLWRHLSCLDLDFQVVKVAYRGPGYYKLKILYIYRGTSMTVLSQTQEVKLSREAAKLWRLVEEIV